MNDRYKLDQFYQGKNAEIQYSRFQELNNDVYDVENLSIVSLAMDFAPATPNKLRKEIERKWIDTLPLLKKVKVLSIRHRVNQEFFEAISEMANLEQLFFWSSSVENISSIAKLNKLQHLKLRSFPQLTDISPLLSLKNLTVLSIDNCFKVENYEVIGKMARLVGLELCGNTFAPKYLRVSSLKPFTNLKNLKHLDLSMASIIDKSYESILELKSLERLDLLSKMPRETREKIKSQHKNLKAGFFVDYDFERHEFYPGKNWETDE
jgi:Leucine-rich repeat (LRR) protein